MLNSILQTLAETLAGGTRLNSTEQIDFSHPSSLIESVRGSSLNLYLYDVRSSKQMPNTGRTVERRIEGGRQVANVRKAPSWFDVSILITARDRTVFGEHRLLTEALSLLMRHTSLREEFLAPELRGNGDLSLSVTNDPPIDVGGLWGALSATLRPAIYLTVTVPFESWKTTVPVVIERHFGGVHSMPGHHDLGTHSQRVSVAGVVKHAITAEPLTQVEIALEGTEKLVTCNPEGLFFFENLRSGNYILQLKSLGFQAQSCNVLVDSKTLVSKEIFLTPA
jgi:hypothetical protein